MNLPSTRKARTVNAKYHRGREMRKPCASTAAADSAARRSTRRSRSRSRGTRCSSSRHDGTWVFDDPSTGLEREPFVQGADKMISVLAKDIPDARNGFKLTFAAQKFPGWQKKLTWVREEGGGNVYSIDDPPMQGWLCPALFLYFRDAPNHIYVR